MGIENGYYLISTSIFGYIVFGVIFILIFFPVIYRENLYRVMKGKILGEFWDSKGDREYIACKVIKEMLIDELDENGVPVVGKSQIVAEIEPPKSHKKLYPSLKNYVTRRDCVDTTQYPNKPFLWSALSIKVKICSWQVGCIEPIDPRVEHQSLPITSSSGFMSGVREHDALDQLGMMMESMQGFMEDTAKKIAQLSKGANNKILLIILAIVGLISVIGAIISFMSFSALSKIGL